MRALGLSFPYGQCKGTTKKGAPCMAKDLFSNGYCAAHGGEGRLLREIHASDKLRRKSQRLAKRLNRSERSRSIVERIKRAQGKCATAEFDLVVPADLSNQG